MVDPNALVGVGLAAWASKEVLTKLIGPTADYIGGEMKGLVEKCNINIGDIFAKAYRKLGTRLEQPGAVNPRVLKNIFDEGKFCEDDLSKEYFAGVLAASRTEDGKDDRGVTNAKLVSNLSSFQIRTHYIFYTLLRSTFVPYGSIVSPGTDRAIMLIYIQTAAYYSAMGPLFIHENDEDRISILAHSMNGLRRNDLIEDTHTYGAPNHFTPLQIKIGSQWYGINEKILCDHGITFQPTPGGMELYLWAHGHGHLNHFRFLDKNLPLSPVECVELPDGAGLLYEDLVKHIQDMRSKDQHAAGREVNRSSPVYK